MKFNIVREVTKTEQKTVNVSLEHCGDGIVLFVDGWHVFRLTSRGTGKLISGIGDRSGLKVDGNGKIILEN